jgi:eukaryotic-like serine/threonine-protein kinase
MHLTNGSKIGRFTVLEAIGQGGMGEVYKAQDSQLGRPVAIKVLRDTLLGNPEFERRLEREAHAISSLSHPNICVLHDIGKHDGKRYLVMEYVDGITLAARLQAGRVPLDTVLEWARDIAAALDQAHRHGVTHRDLKPANIMVTAHGCKLMDFGLARIRAAVASATDATVAPTLTQQGAILGTPPYMAPEQIEGS